MRDAKTAMTLCQQCPKLCRFSCPVADADQNEATTPWGKMTAMKLVEEKKLPMTAETMGLAYKCLNCRLSEEVCELDNPVSSVLDTYRVRAFHAGLAPEAVVSYCKKFGKENNPFGKDLFRELQKRFPERLKGKKRTAYFPGCTEIAREPATIGRTFELLEILKAKEVGLYAEPIQCCGYPLFAAGDWDNFVELAEVNSNALRDYGLILTGAPACLYTMETLYRSAGHPTSAKFMHIVEYLASHLSSLVPRPSPLTVAYHDPCYLGRYRKTYEAPRRLIEKVSGRAPREFFRNREGSYCCGAGGLLPVSFPETAEKITENRIEEFKRTGAELLVSSCPTCVHRFKKFGVRAKNLVEYLFSNL
jgi:Fe-S oxidoreductase